MYLLIQLCLRAPKLNVYYETESLAQSAMLHDTVHKLLQEDFDKTVLLVDDLRVKFEHILASEEQSYILQHEAKCINKQLQRVRRRCMKTEGQCMDACIVCVSSSSTDAISTVTKALPTLNEETIVIMHSGHYRNALLLVDSTRTNDWGKSLNQHVAVVRLPSQSAFLLVHFLSSRFFVNQYILSVCDS